VSGSDLTIRPVSQDDLPNLIACLHALAKDLGDPFHATYDRMADALFGEDRFAMALLASRDDQTLGALLAAPLFSTMGGGASVYVSDLWVAPEARRQAVGRRLLASAYRQGRARWNAKSLKLTVYSDNTRALAFYDRLGFVLQENDRSAIMNGADATALIEALA
jgi:ribosomal protein S18 acetylase RimI-like enzyme